MLHVEAPGLLLGAVALGAVHGVEPGHGWPVAAAYALDRSNAWLAGLAASLLLGVGHLVSSIAMVLAFFYAKSSFELARVDDPVVLVEGVQIGSPLGIVAGLLLVALGIREYRHGHGHGGHDGPEGADGGHGHDDGGGQDHGHTHGDHDHGTGTATDGGRLAALRRALPFGGGKGHGRGHTHGHSHGRDHDAETAADRGLFGIAWFAFVLGFAHEEEFEIIALCTGSPYCLELMGVYALTVVVGIVAFTLALVAGYRRFEERVERYTPYLPLVSAAVLVGMGIGFVLGLL